MKHDKRLRWNTWLLGVASCFLIPIAQLASSVGANTTCYLMLHQPELPDSVKKLRKF